MATALDQIFTASAVAGGTSDDIAWNHTITGGAIDKIVIVQTGLFRGAGSLTDAGSCTCNAVAMTKLIGALNSAGTVLAQIWYLLDPPDGANSMLYTFPIINCGGAAAGIGWTGVHQTTPFGTPKAAADAGSTATTSSVASVVTVAGEQIIDANCQASAASTNFTTSVNHGTEDFNIDWHGTVGGNDTRISGSHFTAVGTSTDQTWTCTTAENWAIVACALLSSVTLPPAPHVAPGQAAQRAARWMRKGGIFLPDRRLWVPEPVICQAA